MLSFFENILQGIRPLLVDGLDWQETILGGGAIAAAVFVVWILCTSITKILVSLLDNFKGVIGFICDIFRGMGRAIRDAFSSATKVMSDSKPATSPRPN